MDKQRYDRLSRPPKTALKQIGGGRLKGMTDVNPQWRYTAMNDEFGPAGEGWKYTIDKLWLEPAIEGQVAAFATISLYTRLGDGSWSAAIPGIGGSMFIADERGGLHVSDEAFKMAVTDALSVALKMLGVAADIYAGMWDGSKYKDAPPETSKEPHPKPTSKPPAPPPEQAATPSLITDLKQRLATKKQWTEIANAIEVVSKHPTYAAVVKELAGYGASCIVDLKPPATEYQLIKGVLDHWERSGWLDHGYSAIVMKDLA